MQGFMRSRFALACGVLLSSLMLAACQHQTTKPDVARAPLAAPEMAPPALAGFAPASPTQMPSAQNAPVQTPRAKRAPAQKAPVGFMLAQGQQAGGSSRLMTANGAIWVLPQPVMTQADLNSVQARRLKPGQANQGQVFVRLSFSPAGAKVSGGRQPPLRREDPGGDGGARYRRPDAAGRAGRQWGCWSCPWPRSRPPSASPMPWVVRRVEPHLASSLHRGFS
ncbi:hypothetical protein CDEF62S_04348 [Castellaniella defragrans]